VPEPKGRRVRDFEQDVIAKRIVGIETRQIDECCMVTRDERRDAMIEKIF